MLMNGLKFTKELENLSNWILQILQIQQIFEDSKIRIEKTLKHILIFPETLSQFNHFYPFLDSIEFPKGLHKKPQKGSQKVYDFCRSESN